MDFIHGKYFFKYFTRPFFEEVKYFYLSINDILYKKPLDAHVALERASLDVYWSFWSKWGQLKAVWRQICDQMPREICIRMKIFIFVFQFLKFSGGGKIIICQNQLFLFSNSSKFWEEEDENLKIKKISPNHEIIMQMSLLLLCRSQGLPGLWKI